MSIPPVRVGVLGCAAVVEYALLGPARVTGALSVEAIASRDLDRAVAYGRRHAIPRWYGSYEELLSDKSLDAIYIAVPNAFHHRWSIEALRHNHAVLCEKPLASNADQAREMVAVSEQTGQLLVEAFHWRHHPLAARLRNMIASGVLGAIRRIEAFFHVPGQFLDPANIRRNFALGGGSMMDQGCYCVSLIRLLGGCEPEVVAAEASLIAADVDGAMSVDLRLGTDATARIECSMNADGADIACGARIVGERGEMRVQGPFLPGQGNRIVLRTSDGETLEHASTVPSYEFQAHAFAAAVRLSQAPWPARDSVANMQLIDAAYRAAGLPLRP
jgi:predicted dehydrogenase